jgi:TPP-dependent pyruvate/acetoin dehydrogenase alpha subunit
VRASYREDEEVELWKQRDPITIHTALLLSQGLATQAEIEQMDAQVTQEI